MSSEAVLLPGPQPSPSASSPRVEKRLPSQPHRRRWVSMCPGSRPDGEVGDLAKEEEQPADWEAAKHITLYNLANGQVSLDSLYESPPPSPVGDGAGPRPRRTVLVFLRKFSCPTCYSYILLFSQLQPILLARDTRLVFITCHTSLSEVKLFIKSFAFWLRTLPKPAPADGPSGAAAAPPGPEADGASPSSAPNGEGGGSRSNPEPEDHIVHPLPGELFLDPQRKAYAFFGIGQRMGVLSGLKELVLSKMRNSMNLTATTAPPAAARRLVTKRNVYTELTSYVSAQMKELLDKAVIDSYLLQSPGIVVLEGRHVLYRWVSKDNRMIENGDITHIAERITQERCDLDLGGRCTVSDLLLGFTRQMTDPLSRAVPEEELHMGGKIGHGAVSNVYQGTWMGQAVAIKYFDLSCPPPKPTPPEAPDDLYHSQSRTSPCLNALQLAQETARRRQERQYSNFANEVALLMGLRHPNIVTLMGFGTGRLEGKPRLFLITELMTQGSLYDVLHSQQLLSPERKHAWLMDIARGVDFLHHCRPVVIHKDLKSLNVLISGEGVAKLADFEISCETGSSDPFESKWDVQSTSMSSGDAPSAEMLEGLEEIKAHGGTYPWMSPENIVDPEHPLKAWDVFAFGVIAWELATRRKPWIRCRRDFLIPRILRGERLEVDEDHWPPAFCALLEDCWKASPRARPSFSPNFLARLGRLVIP